MNTFSKKGSHVALSSSFSTGAALIVRHRTRGQRLRGPCPWASSPCKEAAWLPEASGSGGNCPLWCRWQQGLGDVKKDLTDLLISSFEPPWFTSQIFRGTFFWKINLEWGTENCWVKLLLMWLHLCPKAGEVSGNLRFMQVKVFRSHC